MTLGLFFVWKDEKREFQILGSFIRTAYRSIRLDQKFCVVTLLTSYRFYLSVRRDSLNAPSFQSFNNSQQFRFVFRRPSVHIICHAARPTTDRLLAVLRHRLQFAAFVLLHDSFEVFQTPSHSGRNDSQLLLLPFLRVRAYSFFLRDQVSSRLLLVLLLVLDW